MGNYTIVQDSIGIQKKVRESGSRSLYFGGRHFFGLWALFNIEPRAVFLYILVIFRLCAFEALFAPLLRYLVKGGGQSRVSDSV